jgi:probable F420-dependent oxidoreductase
MDTGTINMKAMKVGAVFPQTEIGADPENVARYAREIERMGYDHMVIYDHVLGAHPDRPAGWTGSYPRAPYTHESPFHEVFVVLGYIAAITTRMGLATSVLVLPQRQTALAAKQAAAIDVLSKGRLRLGVGIGWNAVEYEALREDFHTRGRRIEEQIRLMRALWCDPVVDFSGKWHRVDRAGLNPLPVQRPIPVWMGGGYDRMRKVVVEPALRRIARLADGWFTHVQPGDDAALVRFRELVREEGRDPAQVGLEGRINSGTVERKDWPREIEWWTKNGATHVELNTMAAKYRSLDEHLETLAAFLAVARS